MKLLSPEMQRCHFQGFAIAPLQVLIRRQLKSTGTSPLTLVKVKITAILCCLPDG